MKRPALWIIGGPNGAGKTTLASQPGFQALLRGVRFVNPDQVTLEKLRALGRKGFSDSTSVELRRCFIEAAEEVEQDLRRAVTQRDAVGVESVLSTRKYCSLVEEVIRADGFFGLVYVALKDAELSRERIDWRVAQGGHDVPSEKLSARWRASIENLGWFASRANRCWIIDNSDSSQDVPPTLIAEGRRGRINIIDAEAIPEITRSLATTRKP